MERAFVVLLGDLELPLLKMSVLEMVVRVYQVLEKFRMEWIFVVLFENLKQLLLEM